MSYLYACTIVKKDGSTIVCRVIELNDTEIVYKKWSDLNGSNYVMDKTLASAINYENGKKVNISEATNLFKPGNQNDGVQQFNDRALLGLDFMFQNKNSTSSVRKLKTYGWIGIGSAALGLFCIKLGINADKTDSQILYFVTGGILTLGGATTSIYCFTTAHKRQKQAEYLLQTNSLIRQNFKFENGSSLSTNIDMVNDRLVGQRTLGIGLSYNF